MREVFLFGLLSLTLLSILCIFTARTIARARVDKKDENSVVKGIKITFTILLILCLIGIYYIR